MIVHGRSSVGAEMTQRALQATRARVGRAVISSAATLTLRRARAVVVRACLASQRVRSSPGAEMAQRARSPGRGHIGRVWNFGAPQAVKAGIAGSRVIFQSAAATVVPVSTRRTVARCLEVRPVGVRPNGAIFGLSRLLGTVTSLGAGPGVPARSHPWCGCVRPLTAEKAGFAGPGLSGGVFVGAVHPGTTGATA